ncbi:MAG TPA: hypothetical protein [Caudoviricetes sp.]|nr:MAG TPA: hypothetical protein [Caudoviricetes sp.]
MSMVLDILIFQMQMPRTLVYNFGLIYISLDLHIGMKKIQSQPKVGLLKY